GSWLLLGRVPGVATARATWSAARGDGSGAHEVAEARADCRARQPGRCGKFGRCRGSLRAENALDAREHLGEEGFGPMVPFDARVEHILGVAAAAVFAESKAAFDEVAQDVAGFDAVRAVLAKHLVGDGPGPHECE